MLFFLSHVFINSFIKHSFSDDYTLGILFGARNMKKKQYINSAFRCYRCYRNVYYYARYNSDMKQVQRSGYLGQEVRGFREVFLDVMVIERNVSRLLKLRFRQYLMFLFLNSPAGIMCSH